MRLREDEERRRERTGTCDGEAEEHAERVVELENLLHRWSASKLKRRFATTFVYVFVAALRLSLVGRNVVDAVGLAHLHHGSIGALDLEREHGLEVGVYGAAHDAATTAALVPVQILVQHLNANAVFAEARRHQDVGLYHFSMGRSTNPLRTHKHQRFVGAQQESGRLVRRALA